MKTPWQEVTIKVWRKEEIDTPAFKSFLQEAIEAHISQATKEKANPEDLMPWKQLGRKWHLMKKGLPKRPGWDFRTIEKLLPVVERAFKDCEVDHGVRSKINWKQKDNGDPAVELHTKRKDGVDLVVYVPKDSVTVGAIADFGTEQEVKLYRDGRDRVRIRFESPSEVSSKLGKWLRSQR